MTKIEKFAKRIQALREKRRLTKSALARMVGVTTTCVWNWEEGNTYPRPGSLSRLAAALSTTEEFLEHGVEPPELSSVAPIPDSSKPAPDPVSEVIRRAREEIAAAAGVSVDRVKVLLEYGA